MSRIPMIIGGVALAVALAGALTVGADELTRSPASAMPVSMSGAEMDHPAIHLAAAPAAAANQVVIDNFTYGPAMLTVAAGTKVTWMNDDADPHTVTSTADPKLFKSPPLDTGDSFSFTFDKPGTYQYFCSLHPHMQGKIVVQ